MLFNPQERIVRLVGSLVCTAMLLACFIAAPGARAQMHDSARILALGGAAVSGIIPDFYTDLMINPAYAALPDAPAVNYGYRDSPRWSLPYPKLTKGFVVSFPTTSGYDTSELLVYGLGLSGWRLAAIAEWRILNTDNTDSSIELSTSSSYFAESLNTSRHDDEANYLHAALICARSLGGGTSLGIRFGAIDYYNRSSYQRDYRTLRYALDSESDETPLVEDRHDYSYDELMQRWVSAYLQIGVALEGGSGSRSDAVLSVSREPVYSREDNFQLSVRDDFDSNTQLRDSYRYYRTDWFDRNEGDLWTVSLAGRRVFAGGFTLFGEARYARSPYDCDWNNIVRDYTWQGELRDLKNQAVLDGTGDFNAVSLFVKGGETFELDPRLSVTLGFGGSFARSANEENAAARLLHKTVVADDAASAAENDRSRLKLERYSAALVIPLALEFKPAPYFTCFSGFTAQLGWKRETESCRLPALLLDEQTWSFAGAKSTAGAGRESYGAIVEEPTFETTDDQLSSSYGATVGLSLNFRGRLFCDLYSGSDLTPENVIYYTIDIRYLF